MKKEKDAEIILRYSNSILKKLFTDLELENGLDKLQNFDVIISGIIYSLNVSRARLLKKLGYSISEIELLLEKEQNLIKDILNNKASA